MSPDENPDIESTGSEDPNSPDAIVDTILNGGPPESTPGQDLVLPGEAEEAQPPDPRIEGPAPVADESAMDPAAGVIPEEEISVAPEPVEPITPEMTPELKAAAQTARLNQLEAENEVLRRGPVTESEPEVPVAADMEAAPDSDWVPYEATDSDVTLLRDDPKEFISALVNFMGQANTQYVQESVAPAINRVIQERESAIQRATEAANQFYDDNKDLREHKDIVGAVSAQVRLRNPGKGYEEIKGLIATTARALLTQHGVTLGPTVPLATNLATPGTRPVPGISAGPQRNEDVERTLGFEEQFPV